ncbi:MAG: response regulator [Lachnospiraceae bacterium]|nr:response regulator [Lachnospiraceae bacterium]
MSSSQNAVFILHKMSIIARGLERKLTDRGIRVTAVTDGYDSLPSLASETGVYVLYLPENVMEGSAEYSFLEQVCSLLSGIQSSVLVIGEARHKSELSGIFPILDTSRWFVKPVNPDLFCTEVTELCGGDASASEAPAGASSGATTAASNTAEKKIFLVDDDPAFAAMVRTWLKDTYKTYVGTDGMQAVNFLRKNPVDLVLLDYDMPVVNGPQVLQMLREDPATAEIPIIFLTGVATEEEIRQLKELNPDGYILKATPKEKLLDYLKDWV